MKRFIRLIINKKHGINLIGGEKMMKRILVFLLIIGALAYPAIAVLPPAEIPPPGLCMEKCHPEQLMPLVIEYCKANYEGAGYDNVGQCVSDIAQGIIGHRAP